MGCTIAVVVKLIWLVVLRLPETTSIPEQVKPDVQVQSKMPVTAPPALWLTK